MIEDKDLLEGCLNPEKSSYYFNLLVRKYQEKVYWLVRKMVITHEDADDITQDVFVKVWKNIGQFRQDAQLFTWIYRIATNECLNFLSKKKNRFFIPIGDVSKELLGKLESTGYLAGNEIEIKLQKAILTLPEKQRLVFHMKYFEDLKYEQISEILGTSVGALKASYHHAVKKIEEFMDRS